MKVFLDKHRQIVKWKNLSEFVPDSIENSSGDSDEEDSNKENSDEEN